MKKFAIVAALVFVGLAIAYRMGAHEERDRLLPPAVSVKQGEAIKVLPNKAP